MVTLINELLISAADIEIQSHINVQNLHPLKFFNKIYENTLLIEEFLENHTFKKLIL